MSPAAFEPMLDATSIERVHRDVPIGAAVAALALLGGAVPLLFAWHFGALGVPRNDDWAYTLAAFHLADSSKLNGDGWAGMNLVGQLALSWPVVRLLGHRIAALQIEVAALGVLGLCATFDLAKQLVGSRRALFTAILVASLPMWPSLSVSYMTDVPAFALATACLATGARAVTGRVVRTGYLYLSLAIGFAAFTIREDAIVAPLAVGLATVWVAARQPRRRRLQILAAIVGLITAAGLFYAWRRGLPGFLNVTPRIPTLSRLGLAARESGQAGLLVGLLVSPAVLLTKCPRPFIIGRRFRPGTALAAGFAIAAAITAVVLSSGATAALFVPGDYFLPNGTLSTETLKGARPDLIPGSVFTALAIVGALALVTMTRTVARAIAGAVSDQRRTRVAPAASPALRLVILATIGYAIACEVPVALGYTFLFDRYLLPIVPLVAILALRSGSKIASSRRTRIAACMSLAALAVLGTVYGANSASFDGAKWSVASRAAALVKDPKRIDGGHTWNDYHAGKHLRGRLSNPCIVLRAEPRDPAGAADVVGVARVWGIAGTQVWVVAHQVQAC